MVPEYSDILLNQHIYVQLDEIKVRLDNLEQLEINRELDITKIVTYINQLNNQVQEHHGEFVEITAALGQHGVKLTNLLHQQENLKSQIITLYTLIKENTKELSERIDIVEAKIDTLISKFEKLTLEE